MIFEDENLGEEMIDIVRELHELVPVPGPDVGKVFDRVRVVGTRRPWREGWKPSSLFAMHTPKHDD